MRLAGKRLLFLISDGVDESEVEQLCQGFAREQAMVMLTTPLDFVLVESVKNGRRGRDISIDLPFDSIGQFRFDALIIADGFLSTQFLAGQPVVLQLIRRFHEQRLPIFASGEAVRLLYESQVLSQLVVVREGTSLEQFFDQAVSVMLDQADNYKYRPTME